jgi:hypothetical protein
MAKWNVMFDVSISSLSTMNGLWCEHPHFSPYRASIVIWMSQQENGLEAEIFGTITYHLGLHTDKVSLKSVISTERMVRFL